MASERSRRTSGGHFIYDLPYFERKELCRILDVNNKWELLAGKYMHYTTLDIQELRHQERIGNSPTDQLLNCWGSQNHTILELFILLLKIKHYQAMMILKPFVDPQYHCLLFEGEESINRMLQSKLNTAETASIEAGVAPRPSPSAPSPSSLQDKTLGYSKKNINNAYQHDATPGPSYKAGLSDLLNPQIKIQNSSTPPSEEMNIHGDSQDRIQASGGPNLEPLPGPLGTLERSTSTVRRNSSPTSNLSPVLLIPAPHFPGSQSLNPEADRTNLSPNVSPSPSPNPSPIPSDAGHPERQPGKSPTSQRKLSSESHHSPCEDDLPHISYKELEIATGGWDENNILGRGGFGTVFRGTWKNTQVAVKRIKLQKGESPESPYGTELTPEQSLREMKILRSNPHDNILPLYGYSMGGDQPCLVYKYMANGSLEDRLQCRGDTTVLSWTQRLVIATGTARGLQFLHNRDKPLIHGDIKSANILLDLALEPRIGDFGLAREGPQSHYTHVKLSRVHGTRPYLPDEFLRSKELSTKVDTYSFGVVLFELATGRRAFDNNRPHKYLKDMVEKVPDDTAEQIRKLRDQRLPVNEDLFSALLTIGKTCVTRNPKDRPEMVEVLAELSNRMKTYEIRSRPHGQSNPYSRQIYYDELKIRSTAGSNFGVSLFGSGSPVIGAASPGYYPTGVCPVGNLLGSGVPIYSGLTPAMAINRGSHASVSQDTPSPPPGVAQNPFHSPPQNVLPRGDFISPHYPEFRQPTISVMPPTLSKNLLSPVQSYCETENPYSHPAPRAEIEENVNTENVNAGNIPLLSVLGIKESSGLIAQESTEQIEDRQPSLNNNTFSSNSMSNLSLTSNIDKETSNTNINVSNAITAGSCRPGNAGSNPDAIPPESVLPNLKSLTISQSP